eukprot:TRINITY_DN54647_c0_g1_i1.p1 TRINITY_DN54647_c0_g1~~TRINITY_DN54647_c0_g1_i1.p1  ORF type:complete len:192 (-),score=29.10 TRINITY_DN54647_c0_g1_i1:64-639(-)
MKQILIFALFGAVAEIEALKPLQMNEQRKKGIEAFDANTKLLPTEKFPCNDVHLLQNFNKTFGTYIEAEKTKYIADKITHVCESTPATPGDTANILMYRVQDKDGINGFVENEKRSCQRYSFREGDVPAVTNDAFAPCREGQSCQACADPAAQLVGTMYVKRSCRQHNGNSCVTYECQYVASCCPYWGTCN